MVQYKIEDLNELAETIIESTRNAMRAAISKLPITTTTNTMKIDGYDEEIVLKAKLSVVNDTIVIDYEGSSPISDFGINVPKCYTDAYTSFGVKCVVAPEVPITRIFGAYNRQSTRRLHPQRPTSLRCCS